MRFAIQNVEDKADLYTVRPAEHSDSKAINELADTGTIKTSFILSANLLSTALKLEQDWNTNHMTPVAPRFHVAVDQNSAIQLVMWIGWFGDLFIVVGKPDDRSLLFTLQTMIDTLKKEHTNQYVSCQLKPDSARVQYNTLCNTP